ncbi:MAG: sigma 54-interacting transcriptional regulator [Bryobacteraceae bacterium]
MKDSVVEDEDKLRHVIQLQLQSEGFMEQAATAEHALQLHFDRSISLPTSIAWKRRSRTLTALPVFPSSSDGLWLGGDCRRSHEGRASDFLLKPFSLDHLITVVHKALEVRQLRDENQKLRDELGFRYEFDNIVGRSAAMQEIFATISRVAPTRATVLLAGESGVGKDLIARAIHFHSPRRDMPFVKINCTALPENLMESELFGYEKGAFTGAVTNKPGKFEQADTGTVFLDEIGDVPPQSG